MLNRVSCLFICSCQMAGMIAALAALVCSSGLIQAWSYKSPKRQKTFFLKFSKDRRNSTNRLFLAVWAHGSCSVRHFEIRSQKSRCKHIFLGSQFSDFRPPYRNPYRKALLVNCFLNMFAGLSASREDALAPDWIAAWSPSGEDCACSRLAQDLQLLGCAWKRKKSFRPFK